MRVLPVAILFAIGMTAPVAMLSAAQAPAAGNAAHGAQLFLQCRACHTLVAGTNSVGPNLTGVVGRKAASAPGYTYSSALAQSGLTWTPAELDKFLTHPNAAVPGTKMGFAGVASPAARADIIAYLATLKARN